MCLAPSHSYHVMPPRITRNSHRPRASDRTMVDLQATDFACHSLKLDGSCHRKQRSPREWTTQTSPEKQNQWAGCRESSSFSARGGAFFLTSLFIELIDPICSPERTLRSHLSGRPCTQVKQRKSGHSIRELHRSDNRTSSEIAPKWVPSTRQNKFPVGLEQRERDLFLAVFLQNSNRGAFAPNLSTIRQVATGVPNFVPSGSLSWFSSR